MTLLYFPILILFYLFTFKLIKYLNWILNTKYTFTKLYLNNLFIILKETCFTLNKLLILIKLFFNSN